MPPVPTRPDASLSKDAPAVEPAVEELRVAMALNGGVSLAVWMGGCAVELDRARRAPKGMPTKQPRAYDALCECFGRRLVIDILTGTSAGGINGALLGATIATNGRLEPEFVRRRWLDLGDLSRLLHEPSEESPTALMKGDDFHDDLEQAFDELLETGSKPGPASPPGIVPSLDVTMTDLIGVERRFRDSWGGELVAREHRPRFKFREPAHFTAEALAAAARTSASFPVAFDPWRIEGNARILAGLPSQTYGIDGGVLDNAPIRAALDLIPTRTASSQVRRFVCYLNGDPDESREETIGPPPTLPQVGRYAVNLPRTAPLVDHLYAIRDAVERPRWSHLVQEGLLEMRLDELQGVARALFKTYQRRRTVQSLEELFEAPGDVSAMEELLRKTGGHLPWIPVELALAEERAGDEEEDEEGLSWTWGMRPAQRIVHLLLDMLRPAIAKVKDEALRKELLEARRGLDEQLVALGEARDHVTRHESANNPSRFDEEAALERLQKAVTKAEARAAGARQAVTAAALIFRDAFELLLQAPKKTRPGLDPAVFAALFGDSSDEDAQVAHFFLRVLAIEVIRRAFSSEADIESAERLEFVQLTPTAPTPIFTAAPLDQQSPASVESKLTGVGLGHFAGFYRRSWRANDFMWGRLDAAARMVDLLLASPSSEVGVGSGETAEDQLEKRSACLVKALLGEELRAEREWLLEEALANVAGNAGTTVDEVSPAPGATAPAEKLEPEQLRKLVKATIKAELEEASGSGSRMPFTRAAFQRAAQLEIVAEELQWVDDESAKDRDLGSAAKPLDLGAERNGKPASLQTKIEAVREIYAEPGGSLPQRLTHPGEESSDLGLRTITHAALVGLSAIRTAGLPMAKVFGLVRTPVLAVAGSVAISWLQRIAVAIGFWAAALFLTSQLMTTSNEAPLVFKSIWAVGTLTGLTAVLGIVGVVSVPWLRAWRGVQRGRNAVFVLLLAATAGGVAAVLALTAGGIDSVERILFVPGAETPPDLVLLAPLAAIGVVSLSRLPLPKSWTWVQPLFKVFQSGWPMYVLMIASFALLGGWSAYTVATEIDNVWRAFAAALALVGAPVAVFLATSLYKSRRLKKAV